MVKILAWTNKVDSNDTKLSAKLNKAGQRRISRATAVRWYSNINMMESSLEIKDEVLANVNEKKIDAESILMLKDEEYLQEIELLVLSSILVIWSVPIIVGNTEEINAIGRGNIQFKSLLSDGIFTTICLKNVLYVPGIAENLLSIGTATKYNISAYNISILSVKENAY